MNQTDCSVVALVMAVGVPVSPTVKEASAGPLISNLVHFQAYYQGRETTQVRNRACVNGVGRLFAGSSEKAMAG